MTTTTTTSQTAERHCAGCDQRQAAQSFVPDYCSDCYTQAAHEAREAQFNGTALEVSSRGNSCRLTLLDRNGSAVLEYNDDEVQEIGLDVMQIAECEITHEQIHERVYVAARALNLAVEPEPRTDPHARHDVTTANHALSYAQVARNTLYDAMTEEEQHDHDFCQSVPVIEKLDAVINDLHDFINDATQNRS